MADQATVEFDPDWTIRPGVTLREWLDEQGRTQAWLAQQLGVTEKHVSFIITGRSTYSAQLAVKLAGVTGVSAQFWWRLQSNWLLDRALGRKDISDDEVQR